MQLLNDYFLHLDLQENNKKVGQKMELLRIFDDEIKRFFF